MADEAHIDILERGVEAWNEWRRMNRRVVPQLTYANLEGKSLSAFDLVGAQLAGANLSRANLSDADLSEADLVEAHFKTATLTNADLSNAFLEKSDFRNAELTGANLSYSRLHQADLRKANLTAANLSYTILHDTQLIDANLTRADLLGAYMNRTRLAGSIWHEAKAFRTTWARVDLRHCIGLESVQHSGASTIGIDTIFLSKGEIPQAFLKGAGVPDNFIEYMASLTGAAFEYYSCFISYSSNDEEFAKRLHADLQASGVRCWFATEDMKIGDKIRPRLDEAIRIHDKLLLVLSEHSVSSDWVETEVETALARERSEKKAILFPVRLDDSVFKTSVAWASQIKDARNIGDFTKWKDHDSYEKGFRRLLRDLKSEGGPKPIETQTE
jgi:uncharacterized protein YjbI with pentapeptide repeats